LLSSCPSANAGVFVGSRQQTFIYQVIHDLPVLGGGYFWVDVDFYLAGVVENDVDKQVTTLKAIEYLHSLLAAP